MQLEIQRGQEEEKGCFGSHEGVHFILEARAELTQEEQELVEHYKARDTTLVAHQIPAKGSSDAFDLHLSINDLLQGASFATQDVGTLLELEEKVVEGCHNLKGYLDAMRGFGGKEIIEI